MTDDTTALRLWRRLSALPLGSWLYSRAICLRAPYFGSISPKVLDVTPERVVARVRKRRKVKNHIGTVHALAIGNLCELCAGVLMEASIPADRRWIPRGMTIRYLAKADSDVTATATLPETDWPHGEAVPVDVSVLDESGQQVVHAIIEMYITARLN
ncbi:MAG: hotdog fold domain-containing protein [Gammaproteobacteria bacterium]